MISDLYMLQACLAEMTVDERDQVLVSCVYDLCMTESDVNSVLLLCDNAENLVQRCQGDYNVNITRWRSPSFCGKSIIICFIYQFCVVTTSTGIAGHYNNDMM